MAMAPAAIAIHVLRRAMATSGRYVGMRVRYVTVMSVRLGPALHVVPTGASFDGAVAR
jgi:hypothetical protein